MYASLKSAQILNLTMAEIYLSHKVGTFLAVSPLN